MALVPPPPITQAVVVALAELGDCVCAELTQTGGGEPCWCGLYPGQQVAWESCGECSGGRCGMGYVRVAGVFPSESFPVAAIDRRCTLPLVWAIEVGALRCFPYTSDGDAPPPTEMADAAVVQILDASALHRAIKCCSVEVAVQSYTPVGPMGGCVGGYWTAFLAVE